jgi:flagellar protein FliO/FliZ
LNSVNRITRAARRGALAAGLLLALGLPVAVAATPFAAPQPPALPGPTGGLLRVVVSLALVLAAVVAAAWLMRRLRGVGGTDGRAIEVLAQASLGARERAVLIRVGGHELLLGVAAGSVRTLLVLGDSVAVAAAGAGAAGAAGASAATTAPPSFAAALRTLLARSMSK